MTEKMPERIWAMYCKLTADSIPQPVWADFRPTYDSCTEVTGYIHASTVTAELDKLRGLLREAGEAIKPFIDNIPDDDGWWCPYCGPTECRYDGRCERCGTPIEDRQPDTNMVDALKSILTRLAAEVDGEPDDACPYCLKRECECSDADVDSDMGAR